MNRAQAVNTLGEGCFEWREDVQPCLRKRPRSAFVRSVQDYHRALGAPLPERRRISREKVAGFASGAVELLAQCRERLTFREICARLGIQDSNHGAESRTLRNVMDRLCDTGAVRSFGSYRKLYESAHEN